MDITAISLESINREVIINKNLRSLDMSDLNSEGHKETRRTGE